MDSLRNQIQGCSKCKDLVKSRRQAVPGVGSVPAKLLFIGLAPGRNGADVTGIPFTRDPSGVLFREILEKVQLTSFFITNIVKCNPKDSKGRNRTPTRQEIENCKSFLDIEISKVKPHVIVPLGKSATEFFLGTILNMTSVILTRHLLNKQIIIPLFHPSYVIRGTYKKKNYLNDFGELKKIIEGLDFDRA